MNLRITNGHLLDPANHRDEICDIYIKDGKVAQIVGSLSSDTEPKELEENYETIDASGKYVMP